MKHPFSLIIPLLVFLISACTPHPASGVWKTTANNDYGINQLVISFDGKATFITPKLDNATWHCFWSTASKQGIELKCTPSTNTDKEDTFTLTVDSQDMAALRHNSSLIALFSRQDKNPEIAKK